MLKTSLYLVVFLQAYSGKNSFFKKKKNLLLNYVLLIIFICLPQSKCQSRKMNTRVCVP